MATRRRLFAGWSAEGYGSGGPSCSSPGPRPLTRSGRRLNNVAVLRLAAVVIALVVLAPSPAAAASQTPLARKLSRALSVPHVSRAHTSALAVDLATGKQLYARNLHLALIPASNEKLAVTYASLLALGPSFRFSTDVLGEGELDGTLWRGDVVLKGNGDPTLSTLDLLSLASQLRSQGIRRVTGHVIGDESFFDAKRMAPGWKSYFFLNESPALSALTVDRGRYKGRATRQPALAAALSFRAALLRAGISVAGTTRGGGPAGFAGVSGGRRRGPVPVP